LKANKKPTMEQKDPTKSTSRANLLENQSDTDFESLSEECFGCPSAPKAKGATFYSKKDIRLNRATCTKFSQLSTSKSATQILNRIILQLMKGLLNTRKIVGSMQ